MVIKFEFHQARDAAMVGIIPTEPAVLSKPTDGTMIALSLYT